MAHAQGRSDAFPSILGGPPVCQRERPGKFERAVEAVVYARGGARPSAGAALRGERLVAQERVEGVDRRRVQASAVTGLAERRRSRAAAGGHGDFAAAGKLFCESSACGGRESRAHAATLPSSPKASPIVRAECPPLELVPAPVVRPQNGNDYSSTEHGGRASRRHARPFPFGPRLTHARARNELCGRHPRSTE